MSTIELEKTEITVPDLAKLAMKGTVILTRRGKPMATVGPISGTDWESLALANDPRFVALIEESRRAYVKHGGVNIDELRKELGLNGKRPKRALKKKARP